MIINDFCQVLTRIFVIQLIFQPLPENQTLLTISPKDFNRYLVSVDDVISKKLACPLKIINKSFIVPHFTASNFSWPRFSNFFAKVLDIAPGGEWIPKICLPRFIVALIIALPDKETHLKDFLMHMHPFLQAQNIHYRIYVIEASQKTQFNKRALLNAGFTEAKKDALYPCFIFHDVHLLPKNLNNIYACTRGPRFFTMITDDNIPKFSDKKYFGGAISFLREHFEMINGFSNEFYPWGSENKNFYHSIVNAGLRPMRFDYNTSSYYLLRHKPLQTNPNFDSSYQVNVEPFRRGLNTTRYSVVRYSKESLFTRISVRL